MDPRKLQVLEDIIEHLKNSQAGDLKSLLDESKKPAPLEGSPEEESLESPKEEAFEDAKPRGIELDKVQIMGKPGSEEKLPGEEEMTDEELKELLSKLT